MYIRGSHQSAQIRANKLFHLKNNNPIVKHKTKNNPAEKRSDEILLVPITKKGKQVHKLQV